MPDLRLKPITPLGGTTPRSDEFEGVTISEITDFALASVACRLGKEKACADAAKKLLGFALPKPGQAAAKGDFSAFWTGPDQWMIEALVESHDNLAVMLSAALQNTGSVTEQTGAWVRFDLEGSRVPDVFERCCAVDTRAMAANTVYRTAIEHLGCFVFCRSAARHYSVFGPRSSAASLHHTLVTAAKSALG